MSTPMSIHMPIHMVIDASKHIYVHMCTHGKVPLAAGFLAHAGYITLPFL